MKNPLDILDMALNVAHGEERALSARNYELAAELHANRVKLLDAAWKLRDLAPADAYRKKLLEMVDIQKNVQGMVEKAHDVIRASLQHTHRQQRRLTAYQKCVRMAM